MNWAWISRLGSTVSATPARAREKADTLLLMSCCALIMAPHASHLPAWIIQLCVALLCWRAWITVRGERLPPRWLLLPLCGLAMAGVLMTYKTLLGRDTGVAMLVLLVAFKLLEMHARRDALVVIFLSFFLILMNFFYSQSIFITALMMLCVVMLFTAQLSWQHTENAPPLYQRLQMTAGIVGMAVPLMLVLFILFPRVQGPLWGMPSDTRAGTTGLRESMAPGNISRLALSGDPVLRVRFLDPVPANAKLYWRGPVLGQFDGRTWTPMNRMRPLPVSIVMQPLAKPVRYQVTMEASGQRSLFMLEMPLAIPAIPENSVRVLQDMQLMTSAPIQQRIRYDGISFPEYRHVGNETEVSLRDWVELPPGFNPRTHEFASVLLRESIDPEWLLRRVLSEFRTQNFRYTLSPPPLGQHSVDDFLFNTKAGFCEHFASAFVVIMRALDIPARVVTGYQGGEFNPLDNFMTVRQSDAHAWAEVWLPKKGWVRVDPTAAVAPERIENNYRSPAPQTLLGGLMTLNASDSGWQGLLYRARLNWEAVNNRWNQWVLDYSARQQKSLLSSLGFHNPDWRTAAIVMIAAAILVMAMLALHLLRNRTKTTPIETLYRRFARILAAKGEHRAPDEGPHAWRQRLLASSASAHAPEKRQAWSQFLEAYASIRYGKPEAGAVSSQRAVISRLKHLLSQCR